MTVNKAESLVDGLAEKAKVWPSVVRVVALSPRGISIVSYLTVLEFSDRVDCSISDLLVAAAALVSLVETVVASVKLNRPKTERNRTKHARLSNGALILF